MERWLASIKDVPPDFTAKISVDSILGLYNVGQENVLIRMTDGSDFPAQFYNQAKALTLTVCFSDLAADTSGSATLGETDNVEFLACSAPRSRFNFVDHP